MELENRGVVQHIHSHTRGGRWINASGRRPQTRACPSSQSLERRSLTLLSFNTESDDLHFLAFSTTVKNLPTALTNAQFVTGLSFRTQTALTSAGLPGRIWHNIPLRAVAPTYITALIPESFGVAFPGPEYTLLAIVDLGRCRGYLADLVQNFRDKSLGCVDQNRKHIVKLVFSTDVDR